MPYGKMLIDEIENSSGDTFDLSHSSLSGTNDENSHPASAISTESGLSVQEKLNQSVAVEVETTEYLINAFDGSALSTGDVVRTLGYYAAGDGGGAEWVKTSDTGTASQSPSDFETANLTDVAGAKYEIAETNEINVRTLGAIGDGSNDDLLACRAAFNYGKGVLFPSGSFTFTSGEVSAPTETYNTSSTTFINITNDFQRVRILGDITYRNDGTTDKTENPNCFTVSSNHVVISGGKFYVSTPSTVRNIHTGTAINITGDNCSVLGCSFFYTPAGVLSHGATGAKIRDCYHTGSPDSENGCTMSFGLFSSQESSIENCTSYYFMSDGNIGVFGGSDNCSIFGNHIYNRDEIGNPGLYTAQGIFVDSACNHTNVINNVVDDFYYGIDVKTDVISCNVIGNIVKTKYVGIISRTGEGSDNMMSINVVGNTVVFTQGYTDDSTSTVGFVPSNPVDTVTRYTTVGVIVSGTDGSANVNDNVFTCGDDSNFIRDVCGVCVIGAQVSSGTYKDYPSVVISGNSFNFVRSLGSDFSALYGPLLGIQGYSNIEDKASPSIIFSNNSVHLPDTPSDKLFALIDGFYSRYVTISELTIPRKIKNRVIYLTNIEKVNVSSCIFGESSSVVLYADSCGTVNFSNNQSGESLSDATMVRTLDCDTVLITGNSFSRGIHAGYALAETGATSVIFTSNYTETTTSTTTGVSVTATNQVIQNNIVIDPT